MKKSSSKIILGDDKDTYVGSLPNQRISRKAKQSKRWQRETIDFFINNRGEHYNHRKTPEEIRDNWDFYNTYLSPSEIKKHLDPLNVEDSLIDDEITAFDFYDILQQPFDTLFGEELKRDSEVRAYAVNPNIINEKDRIFKKKIIDYMTKLAEQESINPEEVKTKLQEFDDWRKHDLQTVHEEMANNILTAIKNDSNLNLKFKFNKNFKNYEITGEEIYRIGHIGKELSITPVISENFYVLGMGDSEWIHDGYAWIEIDYMNAHKVIEEFADELTNAEIDRILRESNTGEESWLSPPSQIAVINPDTHPELFDPNNPSKTTFKMSDSDLGLIPLTDDDDSFVDENGNVKVYRIQWLSLRELGILTYYDEEGYEQKKWVDEYYPVNPNANEKIKWIWVNELMEGCRIGTDIYKKVRISPIQMRSQLNPSIVRPTYVGFVSKEKCRIDKLKPYQRMYNIFANKLITLWTQNLGRVARVDVSKIPSEMDTDEWYLWLKRFKLMFENSFEEGKKGAAKGMLAGNMQQSAVAIDLSLADEINQTIQMLNWIEQIVNKIAAVPEPRQGNMTGREGLGVSQQAIVQSSHQTEFDFFIHDIVKSKVFEIAIEYIKVLWKGDTAKRQYLLDDLSSHIIDINGAILNESEYGIIITNSSKLNEMFMNLRNLSHAALQTGIATLSDIARLSMSSSPSEMLRKLEEAEDKRQKQQLEQSKMQQESQAQQLQAQQQLEQMKHQFDMDKLHTEWKYKFKEKELELFMKQQQLITDTNNNGIQDVVEIEKEQLKAETQKFMLEEKLKQEKELKEKEFKNKIELEKMKKDKKN